MKYLIKNLIIFIFFLALSSCHEKDYDVIDAIFKIKKDKKTFNENKKEIESKDVKRLSEEKNKVTKKDKAKIIKKDEQGFEKKKIEISEAQKSRVIKEEQKLLNEEIDKVDALNNFNENNRNIKIGVLLPLSGKDFDIGNMILNALELALFQNKESSIELVIKDTKSEPKISKVIFQELLEKNINFVIGPLYSKTLVSINEQTINSKINILALSNNKSLAKKGVWIFGVDPKEQTERVLDYALERGMNRTAALLPQNSYGLLLFETISNYARQGALQPVRIEFYEDNIKSQRSAAKKLAKGFDEYESYIKKLEALEEEEILKEVKKPFDNVIIAASGQALTVLASQLQYNNVAPEKIQYLGMSSWENNSILNEPALEGGVFATTSQLFQKDIKRIYKNTFEKEMPQVAMIAYDILALLIATEQDKNFIDMDDLINKQGFLGLRGLFRLKETGTVERSFDLKAIKNKKFIILEKAKIVF